MSRGFYDLRLEIEVSNDPSPIISALHMLGFSGLSVFTSPDVTSKQITAWKELSEKYGLDYVTRLDIVTDSCSTLKLLLRKKRRKTEVIAVHPTSKQVARFAARDRRVDILSFDRNPALFDHVQARLMAENGKLLEISARHVFANPLSSSLRHYCRIVDIAVQHAVKIIMCSGAKSLSQLLAPRELASVAFLLGVQENPLKCVRDYVVELISENRQKLSPNFVMPGVIIEKLPKDEKP